MHVSIASSDHKQPMPLSPQCVMGPAGAGQCRGIGAGQDRIGTDLKVISPGLALLLSET